MKENQKKYNRIIGILDLRGLFVKRKNNIIKSNKKKLKDLKKGMRHLFILSIGFLSIILLIGLNFKIIEFQDLILLELLGIIMYFIIIGIFIITPKKRDDK